MSFEKLQIVKPIQKALLKEGYTIPTPIQEQAIPVIMGRNDLLGCAQTGTGKTAAFAIPILQLLSAEKQSHNSKRVIKSLIISPTRELALQIGESFNAYGKYTGLKNTVICGGVSQRNQTYKLTRGVDILIATPGRLLDLIEQKFVKLKNLKILVLDEADRMLDMGFINDVKKILEKLPLQRQTLLFSATMPGEIVKLADTMLNSPVRIEVAPESKTIDAIKQAVYFVAQSNKKSLLVHILKNDNVSSALVFTRTKIGADRVTKFLNKAGIRADSIHGNKSQSARINALKNFKSLKTQVLVATDIASRGIDVEKLSHVINYDMPDISETYIHRIGRTGRAGLGGTALSFCDNDEKYYLKNINMLIKIPVPVIEEHPYKLNDDEENDSSIIDLKISSRPTKHRNTNHSFRTSKRHGKAWNKSKRFRKKKVSV